jgi:uncharacterized protein YdgA (DUF945 family)
MRKSLLVGGGVAVAAVVVVSGLVLPYYMGKSLQSYLMQPANLQAYLMQGATLQSIAVSRHWFSTDVDTNLQYLPQALVKLEGPQARPLALHVTATIQHGPFLIGKDIHNKFHFNWGFAFINLSKNLSVESVQDLKQVGISLQPTLSTSAIVSGFGHRLKGNSAVSAISVNNSQLFTADLQPFSVDWVADIRDKRVHYEFDTVTPLVIKHGDDVLTQKKLSGSLTSPVPLDLKNMAFSLNVRKLTLQELAEKPLQIGSMKISVGPQGDSFELKKFLSQSARHTLNIPSLQYQRVQAASNPLEGTLDVTIPSVAATWGEHGQFAATGIRVTGKQQVSNDLLNGENALNIENVKYNGSQMGPIHLTGAISNWYVPALLDYREVLRQMFWASSASAQLQLKPNLSREEQFTLIENRIKLVRLQYLAMQMWPKVVSRGAALKVDPLSATFSKGSVTITANWQYPPQQANPTLEANSHSEAKVTLLATQDLVRQALVKVMQWQTAGSVPSQQVEQKVQEDLARAVKNQQLIAKDDQYQLELSYVKGALLVNGHALGPQQMPVASTMTQTPTAVAPAKPHTSAQKAVPAAKVAHVAKPVATPPAVTTPVAATAPAPAPVAAATPTAAPAPAPVAVAATPATSTTTQ